MAQQVSIDSRVSSARTHGEQRCVHCNDNARHPLEEQLNRLLGDREEPLVTLVERQIALQLAGGAFAQHRVARALGMSARSLQRRLQECGVTYHALLSGARRVLAERLLTETQASVYEVAFALGYDDVSSFTRAFRSWTGHSPKAWRDEQTGKRASSSRRG